MSIVNGCAGSVFQAVDGRLSDNGRPADHAAGATGATATRRVGGTADAALGAFTGAQRMSGGRHARGDGDAHGGRYLHGVFRDCAVFRRAFRGVVRDSADADGPSRQNRDGPNVERVRVSS
ncbi:hypothetical protein P3T26_003657 [Streptomyces sp. MAA16]|nr:hypothetical protein [Streptomyces sp. MAA16]